MRTSEVLDTAADQIQKRGWIAGQGWNDRDGDPLCLEGGIMAAMDLRRGWGRHNYPLLAVEQCPAYRAVQEYLGLEPHTPRGNLWWWNDVEATSGDEVVAVLRGAAEKERIKEAEHGNDQG